MVYNAIIRSKALYGVESANLTLPDRRALDTFHLKGPRTILRMDTTFGQIQKGDEIEVFGYKTIVERTESFIGFERKVWFRDKQKNLRWQHESKIRKTN